MPRPATTAPRPARAPRGVWRMMALAVMLLLATPALADEFQRNGQWIEGTVIGIADGQMTYLTPAGTERQVPMAELQSLKLDSEPQFFEALEAFQGEDYRAAQRAFGEIAEQTDADWVRHLCWYYQVQALDRRGDPTAAAEVYVEIARDGADAFFLSVPPVASLEEANEDQRGRISAEVVAVMEDADDAVQAQLTAYLRVVVGEGEMPEVANPGTAPGAGDAEAVDRSGAVVILPDSVWSLLERDDAEEKWNAVVLLSEGKADEALQDLDPWLNNPADMPYKLFILGRAQLLQADASGDREMYLDAGLTFMRVAIHYANHSSDIATPARLEVAYIHQQIGRTDIFDKMLFQDNLSLSFDNDPESFPEYYRRYYEILGEPLPSERPEDEEADTDAEDDE